MFTLCLHFAPFKNNFFIFDPNHPCYPEILLFGHYCGLSSRCSPDSVQPIKPHRHSSRKWIHLGAKHSKSSTARNIPSRASYTPNEGEPANIPFSSKKQRLSRADPTSRIDCHYQKVDQENAGGSEGVEREYLGRRWSRRREVVQARESCGGRVEVIATLVHHA